MTVSGCSVKGTSEVLLSTATVLIKNKYGEFIQARALLDSGSQSNFISQELSDQLSVNKFKINPIPVSGISQVETNVNYRTNCQIKSQFNGYQLNASFLVLDKITQKLPLSQICTSSLDIPNTIKLADKNFGTPIKIDLLIGTTIFWDLLCVGQIKLGDGKLILQKTKLGWIIAGEVLGTVNQNENRGTVCNFSAGISYNNNWKNFGNWRKTYQMKFFWEINHQLKTLNVKNYF